MRSPTPLAQSVAQRAWNLRRFDALVASGRKVFDFTSAGSSGRTPAELCDQLALPILDCRLVVDIRDTPFSVHTPSWNQPILRKIVEDRGLEYVHRPDLGVPPAVREPFKSGKVGPSALFHWYDTQVATPDKLQEVRPLLTRHPLFLCTELAPTLCHRHRLALALERALDLVSLDV
ncbi:MAG: DUF488 domain-containing protein [Euryarchaeota archaeon]|nr:DUF488 domain-containing protein [Euryarchaeota archaeon]MDE1835782.1 DUF488 domain-containing protein [Euryarchaeota archaeon]MDE1880744.1 DUF488 domain-containing protein [Euryarchaeota archaeon]MDE2043973.1 DUF488 domain-containing protein [Thermoplasmata archaeon]